MYKKPKKTEKGERKIRDFMKILAGVILLLALNSFVYADVNHYGNNSMMGQEMMNTDSGMNTNCVAKYNFLTGILNVPCVDAGGEIYWINLKLKQEGNKITMELVDAGENDNISKQMGNYHMNEDEMKNNQNMMDENDEMMDNQSMMNEREEMMNYGRMGSRRMMNYR